MSTLEIFGFIFCLWAMAFLIGFGLMMGLWAGVHVGALAFGAFNVKIGDITLKAKP